MSLLHVILYATEVEYYWRSQKKKQITRKSWSLALMTKTDPVLAFRRRWQTLNSFRPLTPYHRFKRLMFLRSARTSSALFCMLFSGHKNVYSPAPREVYNNNKRVKQ